MADKMAELLAALEGMSDEALRLVLEFTEFLKKQDKKVVLRAKKGAPRG